MQSPQENTNQGTGGEKKDFFVFGGQQKNDGSPQSSSDTVELLNEVDTILSDKKETMGDIAPAVAPEGKEDMQSYGVMPVSSGEDRATPPPPEDLSEQKQIPVPREREVNAMLVESETPKQTAPQRPAIEKRGGQVPPQQPSADVKESTDVAQSSTSTFLKTLRTFKTDVTETIQREKRSITDIALAAHTKREGAGVGLGDEEKKFHPQQFLLLGLGALFILGTLGLGFYVYTNRQEREGAFEVIQNEIIFTEEITTIALSSLSRAHIESQMRKTMNETRLTINDIARIRFTRETAPLGGESAPSIHTLTAPELLLEISQDVPAVLTRTLDPTYILGLHALSQNHPFLILKTTSFDRAFGGMLLWEGTMLQGLTPLFLNDMPRGLSRDARFEDVIVKNQDARMLRDASNQILLLYSFIDEETLLIATNEVTFDEVVKRLKQPGRVTR
ncbi:MAG: hypothetical protein HY457_01820 [Parcubacteria group bacterium]|nr:hypothetical protein [Parcubacteria group bacterium]